jgi:hypothetical protein
VTPQQIQLLLFVEQMIAQAAKLAIELRAQIQGASTKSIDEVLDDADSTYQQIINNAKQL